MITEKTLHRDSKGRITGTRERTLPLSEEYVALLWPRLERSLLQFENRRHPYAIVSISDVPDGVDLEWLATELIGRIGAEKKTLWAPAWKEVHVEVSHDKL